MPPDLPAVMRILFVDDEPNVLDGIRRTLHSMRTEWSMEFASSGPDALAALTKSPADVVVADMRMPGMDGCELLAEVKRLYPQAVRLILSGHVEPNTIMRVAGIAHQYLTKPCDSTVLKTAILRTRTLRKLIHDGDTARRAGGIDNLPSLPGVYQQLVTALQQPGASLADIGRLIGQDLAMTAMILKFVNSAFFGARQSIQTVGRAVAFLGVDTISSLVLAHGVFKPSRNAAPGLNLQRLWQHSLETAAGARALAMHEHWDALRVEEAFLAALLHDVGRIVMAEHPAPGTVPADDHHATIGAYLLGLWGFSDAVVEAVAFHHSPGSACGAGFGLPALLHVADSLAHESLAIDATPAARPLDPALMETAYVKERWSEWQSVWQQGSAEPRRQRH